MLFLACFCASQRVQRRIAELHEFGKSYQTAGPIGTKFGTPVQIHNGNGYTPNKLPLETQGGTWGVLGGQTFKSVEKLSNGWTDWHQLWFTSAEPSGNGHRLNTSRPSIHRGHLGG